MKRYLTLSLILSSALFGAGYQVPNNSVNSAALATAYVANANGADAAYYNPANMVYNGDNHEIEGSLTYVSLSSINYKSTSGTYDINSKKHTTLIPSLNYASNKLTDSGIRVGFSIASPYGSTREWSDFPATAAKKFSLKTVELNPSIAIPITNQLSVGLGVRYVIASGDVQVNLNPATNTTVEMDGEDKGFAYNLAITYQASEKLNLAATYRSDIMLNIEGNANVVLAGTSLPTMGASLKVAIPDNLILAAAYKLSEQTTVEATFDMTMWSRVTEQDFNYSNATVEATALGTRKEIKWHDSYAYRLGITHQLDDTLTIMGGIAYSTNPADEADVSFSSPESDSMTYALGGRYTVNKSLELGLAVLYADYKTRTANQVANAFGTQADGTFSNRDALTVTIGAGYKF